MNHKNEHQHPLGWRVRTGRAALGLLTFAVCAPGCAEMVEPQTTLAGSIAPIAVCADGVALLAPGSPGALNDRCDLPAPAALAGVVPANVVMLEVPCADDTSVWVAAERGTLLVASDVPIAGVVRTLRAAGLNPGEPAPVGGLDSVFAVPITDTIDIALITDVIPAVQGVGYRVDLNYLEPVLPQNGFRSDDDPLPAGAPPTEPGVESTSGSGKRVLVVDSPLNGIVAPAAPPYTSGGSAVVAQPPTNVSPDGVQIDHENNGFTDEDHSHGLFVAALIKRLAPGADVTLRGLDVFAAPQTRTTPLWFSDSDVIAAIHASTTGVAPFDVLNLSLGGAGCETHANRLVLADYLADVVSDGTVASIVSAAGNDGTPSLHFPAAFASPDWWTSAAAKISDASGPVAAQDFAAKSLPMTGAVISVGSGTGGSADCFSNHGAWVKAWAPGAAQVSRYQTPTGDVWAQWSGTSFATARVTAALITGATVNSSTNRPASCN